EALNTDVRAALQSRQQALLDRHGGAWLGSLWHRQPWRTAWHRGLLSAHLSWRLRAEDVQDALPWIDTALFVIQGRQGLLRAVDLLPARDVTHLHLDVRSPGPLSSRSRAARRPPRRPKP